MVTLLFTSNTSKFKTELILQISLSCNFADREGGAFRKFSSRLDNFSLLCEITDQEGWGKFVGTA